MLFVLNHYLCNQEKGRLFIYHLYLLTEQSMNRQNDSPTRTKHWKEQFQYKPNHKFLKMKRLAVLLFAVAAVMCANAKILRVSNINGSTAPYSTVKAALEAAETGDVIMVDASPDSYGDVEINKSVTIQGPGYWLLENNISQEGCTTATFGTITLSAEGIKISSVNVSWGIRCNGQSNWVITRCKMGKVSFNSHEYRGVLHQNYITGDIDGVYTSNGAYAPYSVAAYLQITNNIIGGKMKWVKNSVIKYNTAINGKLFLDSGLSESTFEYNIGFSTVGGEKNTYANNIEIPEGVTYKNTDIDSIIKETDATISTTHGAFAGEDPYVISGIAPGPYIEDITVPVSVEQGKDMEVTVKIGTSR